MVKGCVRGWGVVILLTGHFACYTATNFKMSQNRFGPGYGPSYGTSQADESSDSQWMEYESFEHEEVCLTSRLC